MLVYKTILLLGGTEEAYHLAETLYSLNINVLSSLAGRTKNPRLPKGKYRIGGFGGRDGLIKTIHEKNIGLILDATHNFAENISKNAIEAAKYSNIDYIRFERPLWQKTPKDNWLEVPTIHEAINKIPQDAICFLALGRQYITPFAIRKDVTFYARMLEKPNDFIDNPNMFKNFHVLLEKPKNKDKEKRFLQKHRFDVIICRNSGAKASFEKVLAAREIGLPIIMLKKIPNNEIPILTSVDYVLQSIFQHKALNFQNPLAP